MYYTHLGYQTSIFGKIRAYYIRIFTAIMTDNGLLCICERDGYCDYISTPAVVMSMSGVLGLESWSIIDESLY